MNNQRKKYRSVMFKLASANDGPLIISIIALSLITLGVVIGFIVC